MDHVAVLAEVGSDEPLVALTPASPSASPTDDVGQAADNSYNRVPGGRSGAAIDHGSNGHFGKLRQSDRHPRSAMIIGFRRTRWCGRRR